MTADNTADNNASLRELAFRKIQEKEQRKNLFKEPIYWSNIFDLMDGTPEMDRFMEIALSVEPPKTD